jgi:hypothetical protein
VFLWRYYALAIVGTSRYLLWQKRSISTLIARGATVNNPISILFEAYLVVLCHHFKLYICRQHEDYLYGKLTTITHKALMTSAKHKFDSSQEAKLNLIEINVATVLLIFVCSISFSYSTIFICFNQI